MTYQHPDAFQHAYEAGPRPFYSWHNGQPIPAFRGIVRVFFSSGPAWDFSTWLGQTGKRNWKSIGRVQ